MHNIIPKPKRRVQASFAFEYPSSQMAPSQEHSHYLLHNCTTVLYVLYEETRLQEVHEQCRENNTGGTKVVSILISSPTLNGYILRRKHTKSKIYMIHKQEVAHVVVAALKKSHALLSITPELGMWMVYIAGVCCSLDVTCTAAIPQGACLQT